MAPVAGITIPYLTAGKFRLGFWQEVAAAPATDAEELQQRNLELESQLREGKAREAEIRLELERTKGRLMAVEEAEERLCAQLGELEAEAIHHARDYNRRIKDLSDLLSQAQRRIDAGDPTNL